MTQEQMYILNDKCETLAKLRGWIELTDSDGVICFENQHSTKKRYSYEIMDHFSSPVVLNNIVSEINTNGENGYIGLNAKHWIAYAHDEFSKTFEYNKDTFNEALLDCVIYFLEEKVKLNGK